MAWDIELAPKVKKNAKRLPAAVLDALVTLTHELQDFGPVRGNWPNYGKLGKNRHHCHLKKGNPTYVAVWEEKTDGVLLIKVIYAGTHEKAPY